MSEKKSVIVFIGSFDPVHRGHIEAAEKALERHSTATNVVFLPNNTRKGKPDRTPLPLRAHWLSFWMPLHNTLTWLGASEKLVCDTRECDYVVSLLKKTGCRIVGLVGSDVSKQPKLSADEWIVVERVGVPFSDIFKEMESAEIPVHRIAASECRWQHLSSSNIRRANGSKEISEALHERMIPFVRKNFQGTTLSSNTVAHETEVGKDGQKMFKITFVDANAASAAVKNAATLQVNIDGGFPFRVATVQRWTEGEQEVVFSFCHGKTLFDVLIDFLEKRIDEATFTRIFTHAFVRVQYYYRSLLFTFPRFFHNDPSIKNILYDEQTDTFSLVDYEQICWLTEESQVDKYYSRFASSVPYYMILHGLEDRVGIASMLLTCEKRALEINGERIRRFH